LAASNVSVTPAVPAYCIWLTLEWDRGNSKCHYMATTNMKTMICMVY